MRVYNNEIIIQKGETFTIDAIIQSVSGAPYIISNKLSNPYFLLTVSDSKFIKDGKYIENWWLDLSKIRRFYTTIPIEVNSFDDVQTTGPDRIPENYALYYIVNTDGTKTYKYFDYTNDTWKDDYKLRLIKLFMENVTSKWNAQNYFYGVQLVAGLSTLDILTDLCSKYGYTGDQTSLQNMYSYLYSIDKTIVDDIDISKPIAKYSNVQIILPPTKLTVVSNINGSI